MNEKTADFPSAALRPCLSITFLYNLFEQKYFEGKKGVSPCLILSKLKTKSK